MADAMLTLESNAMLARSAAILRMFGLFREES
jgi:hypothetical protein